MSHGPAKTPSKIRFCSGGFVGANALRASKCASRNTRFPSPWSSWPPGFVRISIRPRPGRAYSAEYGSWLILICWMADALTRRALTSMPLTTIVGPPDPSEPESRKRDIVAMTS